MDFLKGNTQDQGLLDIISRYFFQQTPAFFALNQIGLYLDYQYPLGGTGRIVEKMVAFIKSRAGMISTNTAIVPVDPKKNW